MPLVAAAGADTRTGAAWCVVGGFGAGELEVHLALLQEQQLAKGVLGHLSSLQAWGPEAASSCSEEGRGGGTIVDREVGSAGVARLAAAVGVCAAVLLPE